VYRARLTFFPPVCTLQACRFLYLRLSPSLFLSAPPHLTVLTLPAAAAAAAVADKSVIKEHLADDWNFPEH